MERFALGLDFGTLSVRALLVNAATGEEAGSDVFAYPHKSMETTLPSGKVLPQGFALQDPEDYLQGMVTTVQNVMERCQIRPEQVIGIGVDFTSSTVIATDKEGIPMCKKEAFRDEPHAYVKLWKHHGAEKEAQQIDEIARKRGEEWLSYYGGKVSSEWMIPKIVETFHKVPDLYEKTDRFMEALDWIIWRLTGKEIRSTCGAGYKAFYRYDTGYPEEAFFEEIHPQLKKLVKEKLEAPLMGIGGCAGYLTEEMAQKMHLRKGTPVGVGIVDAHASVPGSGIGTPGTMMVIVGTSSCHLMLSETEVGIEGVGGLVKDGIMPGYYGYEAGQCCVGDHFAWFVRNAVPEEYATEAREKGLSVYSLLEEKLKGYQAGKSGLLALDWFNGVRSPLMDFDLNGLIIGLNLQTKPEEIYLALMEATAYGTRQIIEDFERAGVRVDSLVLGGGIPAKSELFVQIYADVTGKEIRVSGSDQTCALGAAILGIAAAPPEISGYENAAQIAEKIGKLKEKRFIPDKKQKGIYDLLYREYRILTDYFGRGGNRVMKTLNRFRDE